MADRGRGYELHPAESEHHATLIRLGFDLNLPMYEILCKEHGLDIELVKRALFESTYRDPVFLPLAIEELTGSGPDEFYAMVVHSVRAVFPGHENDHLGRPVGCYNEPDWLVSGYLVKSAHDPYPEYIAALAFLMMDGTDRSKIEIMNVQLRREMPSGSPPDITDPRTA